MEYDAEAEQNSITDRLYGTPDGLKLLKYVKDLLQTKIKVHGLMKTWKFGSQCPTNNETVFVFKLTASDKNKMKKLSKFMSQTSNNLYELVKTCDKSLIQTIDDLVYYCGMANGVKVLQNNLDLDMKK